MAADYRAVNGTDADILFVTGSTASAMSTVAASATSAEIASYVSGAGARAIIATAATAAEKKALAWALLKSAGVNLGTDLASVANLATPEQRLKYKNKRGLQELYAIAESIAY